MSHFFLILAAASKLLVHAKPLAYPEGVQAGDKISGSSGEFWRYKHVLIKPPDDDDRAESLQMAADVKCDVCETILLRLLKRSESNREDHIMDMMDGDLVEEPELTGDAQTDRVNHNKRGCNKHFKDELLAIGYYVKECPAASIEITKSSEPSFEEPLKPKAFCLQNSGRHVDSKEFDTYSVRNDALYYACENTIAKYAAELATALAESFESGGDVTSSVKKVCRQQALCDGRKEQKTKQRKSTDEKKKKRKRKGDEEEKSYFDIMNEQKEEKKRRKKHRRKVEM